MDQATISWLGDARVSVGQAFTVQRLFRDPYGNAVDLSGRSFLLTFFGTAGMQPIAIEAEVDGPIAAFGVSSGVTEELFAAQQAGSQIRWQITERVGGVDADFVFGPRTFRLLAAGPTSPGAPGGPALRINSGGASAVVNIDSIGSPGFSAAQQLLQADPDNMPDASPASLMAWLALKATGINLLDLFPVAPALAAEDVDGTEQLLVFKAGGVHSITFDQLALALARYRTLNLATPAGTAIADAIGILG